MWGDLRVRLELCLSPPQHRTARLRHPGEAPSPDSRTSHPFLAAAGTDLGGKELALFDVEAGVPFHLPFVEARAAEGLVVGANAAGGLEFDDVAHPGYLQFVPNFADFALAALGGKSLDGLEQALAVDHGHDQHAPVLDAVDHPVAIDKPLSVGGDQLGHTASTQGELRQASGSGDQLLDHLLRV